MRLTALALTLCCGCIASLAGAPAAGADLFAPIQLESLKSAEGGGVEQAERAEESSISANGQYIVFRGSFDGITGIWRRELYPEHAVVQVAPGGELPSISANGQYVSFTTSEALVAEDDRGGDDNVWVRDMGKECTMSHRKCAPCPEGEDEAEREACPFVLVSAVDGSSEGATYEDVEAGQSSPDGSFATGRSAIDAEGNLVVFETAAQSNLLGSPASTPAYEILLRNLETKETTLVSSEYDPQTNTDTGVPVPTVDGVGAAYPPESSEGHTVGGASISAEGNAVAWLGRDIGRQARLLPGEQEIYGAELNEPLWRSIDEGPTAPTLRVTGGSEPDSQLCIASGEQELPQSPSTLDPCQGPFGDYEQNNYFVNPTSGNVVPQLSADGDTVAFLASAREVAAEQELKSTEADNDLYISHMNDGLTRTQALERLTKIAGSGSPREYGDITDLAISPDGSQVGFTTERTDFPLPSPTYISPIAPQLGIPELYEVDLDDETVTRVTHGYGGEAEPSQPVQVDQLDEGASSPSFDESGEQLAFSSTADNLVYGDGNGSANVYLTKRIVPPSAVPAQFVSAAPPPPSLEPAWQLSATVAPQDNGTVLLYVSVPGAGELGADATGLVPVTPATSARKSARARARRASARTELLTRTVASAHAAVPASSEGLERLTPSLAPAYRALAQRAGGLYT
ncbi:MAG TPA: hypothetical protein VED41_10530, partial [Solirubrobacteraceae bacterium]|nr:hypothetical protein [Solirubrobacteraceae bacterium]